MQTKTITQIKKFKLSFEKFDDWVYVKCSKESYLLTREYFDKMEAKHTKGKFPYNWILKIPPHNIYCAYSRDYLNRYFKQGLWGSINHDKDIINALPLLRKGVKDCYYHTNVYVDGYLHFGNKRMRRPISLELNGYHSKRELIEKLKKNPKIISAELKDIPYYNQDGGDTTNIHIVYLPSKVEFNKMCKENKLASSWDTEVDIVSRLNIKKFKCVEYDD